MFELIVALKYLIPKKKQLSLSLIALMSVVVISLVVWLLLVFLSVTEGIERGWLNKLTTLNAPLRITPTQSYYDSYYFRVDEISADSGFKSKNIAQKRLASLTDPFNSEEDGEIPLHFPAPEKDGEGNIKNSVSLLFSSLEKMKEKYPGVTFQDFEMSGAMMRLQLLRPGPSQHSEDQQSYLTQVSYLASFPAQCPELNSLLIPASEKDLNHLLYLASHATENSRQDSPALTLKSTEAALSERLGTLLREIKIQTLKPKYAAWQFPSSLLPENKKLTAHALIRNNQILRLEIPAKNGEFLSPSYAAGKLWRSGDQLHFELAGGTTRTFSSSTPLFSIGPLKFEVDAAKDSAFGVFPVAFTLQDHLIHTDVSLDGLSIEKATYVPSHFKNATNAPTLGMNDEMETGVLIAKSYQDSGVLMGDRGYLSYSSVTAGSVQEHRLPIFVAGFYDPGILSIGNKCILVPPYVTETINASNSSFNLDKTQSNGVQVWFNDLYQAERYKQELVSSLQAAEIDHHWKVSTFKEYDFAKDLMQQFQSDRYLFTMIGIIILIVACCNIISLLVLLVNDKKQEIGILQAMGASRLSIASIFGICGMGMGIISSIIGICAAILTLHHIDSLVYLLSLLQGQDAFNAAFFGKTLPNELSNNAVYFILIATPLLSLFAGLVPALKACRMRPSKILRSE